MVSKWKLKCLLAAAMLFGTSPAYAADFSVNLTATNFRQTYPDFLQVPPPVNPVYFIGHFNLDISNNADPTTSGLAVQYFNMPYGVQYAYDRPRDTLIIGTYINGSNGNYSIPSTPSSWFVAIGGAFYGTPFAYNFVQMVPQSSPSSPFTYSTTDVGIILRRLDVAGVPEPDAWALMLLGFAGLGHAVRRHRRSNLSAMTA